MKAEKLEPIKETCAVRKRVSSVLIKHFAKSKRQYEQALPFLSSLQECLAAQLGSYEEDSEKENQDVEEGPSHGFLRLIPSWSASPIPIPPPCKYAVWSVQKMIVAILACFTPTFHKSIDDSQHSQLSL